MKTKPAKSSLKPLMLALAVSGLTGCLTSDSDDDDSDDSVDETPEPSVQITPSTMGDASTLERDLDPSVEAEADIMERASSVISPEPNVVAASWDRGTIVMSTSVVDRPQTITLDIQSAAGNTVGTFDVHVENTTSQALENEADAWLDDSEALANLEESFGLYRTVALSAYVTGDIDGGEYNDLRDAWGDVAETETGASLQQATEDLEATYQDQYKKSEVGEDALRRAVNEVEQAANTHFQAHGEPLVNEAFNATELWSAPSGEIAYDEPTQTLSRYIGNLRYGDHVDDKWAFNSSAAHLEAATGLTNLAMCQVEVM